MQKFNPFKPAPGPFSDPRAPRGPTSMPPVQDTQPIYFYDKDSPYYSFANFSPHPVTFNGSVYPTAEHLFQAMKFMSTNPALSERLRQLPTPREALEFAIRHRREQRADWYQVNIEAMDTVLASKFAPESQLAATLLGTGSREIYENSPTDSFWGIGSDGRGRNELGKALMRCRAQLRSGRSPRLVVAPLPAPLPEPVKMDPIDFFDKNSNFYHLSNQSSYAITHHGKIYPTAAHLYYALKFAHRVDLLEQIRMQPSPEAAQTLARRLKDSQPANWSEVRVGYMDLVVEEKFAQHPELRKVLKNTGTRELRYVDPDDYWWGIGRDHTGRNELGKALMRLRAKL